MQQTRVSTFGPDCPGKPAILLKDVTELRIDELNRLKDHDPVTITQQELETRLWGAANALRGPVDPADFKTYVFPMLFWKWISDSWAYEHAEALAEYGDDLDDEIEADFHRFEMPVGTLWADVTTKVKNLGPEIARTFQQIEKANPRSLAGVFGDASWGNQDRIPESALLGLIKAFNQIRLDPSTVSHDLLGAGYEYLLKNFADESGKKAGEFFTPREVVHLLVGILEPQPGESIYDPAFMRNFGVSRDTGACKGSGSHALSETAA